MTYPLAISEKSAAQTVDPQDLTHNLRQLLAGLASFAAVRDDRMMNQREMRAVHGMMAYVAYTNDIGVEVVAQRLVQAFQVDAVDKIPASQYHDAIEYLMNLPSWSCPD